MAMDMATVMVTAMQNNLEAESEDNENLDMDEDMMLAGLSMFDSEI